VSFSAGFFLSIFLLLAGASAARADATLLMEDPVNFEGWFTSVGHSAVLMDRLCTDDHVSVRLCRAGETGSVISRYPGLKGHLDWLAMPADAYLFAAEAGQDIPATMTREEFFRRETEYRAQHAASFAVDPGDKGWVQLVGESYRRRIVAVRVHTSEAQDERLMQWLNGQRNVSRFNIFSSNCADFVGQMLGVLFPHAFHRSYLFDAGMMTPKQNLADLHRYAMRHGALGWEVTVLSQAPGDLPRSGHLYGVTESYLKHYWFLLPLDCLLPVELGIVTGLGIADHRYVARPGREPVPESAISTY
jgi:hypothetical protein